MFSFQNKKINNFVPAKIFIKFFTLLKNNQLFLIYKSFSIKIGDDRGCFAYFTYPGAPQEGGACDFLNRDNNM